MLFKTKLKLDGSINRLKARLVVRASIKIESINFNETFVIKTATIRLVLTISRVRN